MFIDSFITFLSILKLIHIFLFIQLHIYVFIQHAIYTFNHLIIFSLIHLSLFLLLSVVNSISFFQYQFELIDI